MEDAKQVQQAAPGAASTTSPAEKAAAPAPKPGPAPAQPGAAAAKPAAGKPAQPAAAKPAPPAPTAAKPASLPPPAPYATPRKRHWMLLLVFVIWVLAPMAGVGWYLYTVAKDQYASHVGFSVRTEEIGSAIELLGGITQLSGSSSSDTDILFEFIQSQQMVRAINAELDLAAIYSAPEDPYFGLGDDTRIEALAEYWQRMVKVFYDRSSGLIEVRVVAFDPVNAQKIARAIFATSSAMINQLSTIARSDATRYAEEELERAQERLKATRQATTAFRNRTGIIDPQADIQGQMGVVNALQSQLAEALVSRQTLLDSATSASDPRVTQLDGRIEAIRKQITAERSQFGGASGPAPGEAVGDGTSESAYSTLLEEYESLEVDREFAEKSFLSSLAARDAAVAEAQRQLRYLASYIDPTLAETPEYPRRIELLLIIGGILFLTWCVGAMIYYSLRDRR
ncbi:sugar transporter [Puniceibacterium sp. IMCC21224]|uniref:sugar transporter n=1 Tax=Puniceibacterium sp. IMCC21224 TaxID=1618204 RepID=UPI00064DFABE|nr:sugar transporter [Puniceibacterium sp. IMCC21224]KMK63985.1 capsule polysaccharide export protein [Puniceibacterium sp. IMCC21224]